MFAYGICAGPSGKVDTIALPALAQADPEGLVIVKKGQRSIFEAYNNILDELIGVDIEGLVLLHDDLELLGTEVAAVLRTVFADPTVGLVGLVGGRAPRSLRWWLYESHGSVEEMGRCIDFGRGQADVDVVDGILLALAPGLLGQVRFDAARYNGFHGYDADLSLTVAALGYRVVVADIPARHHANAGRVSNVPSYRLAGLEWQSKWLVDDPLSQRLIRRLSLTRARLQLRAADALEQRGLPRAGAQFRRRVPVPKDQAASPHKPD